MPKPSLFYLALWWESLFYPQWMCHLHPQFQHFINAVILFLWKRLHLIKISNIIIVPCFNSSFPYVCKVFRSNHVSNYWFKIYLMHCLTTRWSIVDYWYLIYVLEGKGQGSCWEIHIKILWLWGDFTLSYVNTYFKLFVRFKKAFIFQNHFKFELRLYQCMRL